MTSIETRAAFQLSDLLAENAARPLDSGLTPDQAIADLEAALTAGLNGTDPEPTAPAPVAVVRTPVEGKGEAVALARNSARYCDGLTREFTARFPGAGIGGADLWAAVAGQTCADPLDCVALTEAEAHAAGQAWARRRCIRIGTDLSRFYRVEPLPMGWSNDGTPVEAIRPPVEGMAEPVMVPMPAQQQQARDARHAQGILSPGCIPEHESRRGMARCDYPGKWQIGIYSVVRCGDGLWAATAIGPGTIGDGSFGQTFPTLAAAYLALTGEPMPGAR